jgi:uncharacterized protein (PEP-CTERM system associated)
MKVFSLGSGFLRWIFFWATCVVGLTLWVFQVNAAEWTIQPRLTVMETYTDNVRMGGLGGLGGAGGGGSEFITQINPGLAITGVGRRFNTSINYTLNNLFFAKNQRSIMRQQLSSNATAEILKDLFFVDGRAAIFQQNAFLFGPQAFDNANLSGNIRDMRTWSVSPYLRHRFKNLASGELRYARSAVTSSARNFFSNTADSVIVSLNSGSAFRTLGWGVNYSNTQISRERGGFDLGTIELERIAGTLNYVVTSQFNLVGTGGYERNSFLSIRGKPSSHFWTAGFSWAPTTRTNIDASAGKRFFGNTYAGSIAHRTRRTVWNLSYVEDITTFGQQALLGGVILNPGSLGPLIPNIQDSQALLDQGLPITLSDPNNFLTNRLFLLRRLQASLTLNGRKNSLVFRAFNFSRKSFTADDEDVGLIGAANAFLTRDTTQTGGNVLWNHRLSPLTSANANFGYTRIHFNTTDQEDDMMIVMLSLNKRFAANTNGVLRYRHMRRESSRSNSDFSANTVSAILNMNF